MSWVCGIDILKGDATKKEIELTKNKQSKFRFKMDERTETAEI